MSAWGDELDEELKNKKELKVGFVVGFKSMNVLLERIEDETIESNEKHPKQELMKIWFGLMLVFLILFLFTYSVLALVTVFFYMIYGYVLFRMFKTWKRFKYSKLQFWLMTILTLAAECACTSMFRIYVLKL